MLNEMTHRCRPSTETLAIAIGILIAGGTLSFAQTQNNQQNGQWCAYFTGGPVNCSFSSLQQCMDAIRGKTALCNQNAQYVPPNSGSANGREHRSADR